MSEAEDLAVLNTLIYEKGFIKAYNDLSGQKGTEAHPSVTLEDVLNKILSDPMAYGAHDEFITDEQYWSLVEHAASTDSISSLTVVDLTAPGTTAPGTDLPQTSYNMTLVGDEKMYVVFRGTFSGEWADNMRGLYQSDTQAQVAASEYVTAMDSRYGGGRIVVVSGHSKGGNKAMYSAITNPAVDGCYSFDGQGFGPQFLGKYAREVAERRGIIHAYNYEGDFVSALLEPVAGETHFTERHEEGVVPVLLSIFRGDAAFLPENHAPISLFADTRDFSLDVSGTPSDYWRTINGFTSWVVHNLPAHRQEAVAEFLGGCADNPGDVARIIGEDPEAVGTLVACLGGYPGSALLLQQLLGTDPDLDGLADLLVVGGLSVPIAADVSLDTLVWALKDDRTRALAIQWLLSFLGIEVDTVWLARFEAAARSTQSDVERGAAGASTVAVRREELRDWSEGRLRELMAIADEADWDLQCDITQWDSLGRVEGLLGADASGWQDEIHSCLRRQLYENDALKCGIWQAFQRASEHDAQFASAIGDMPGAIADAAAQLDGILA